MNSIVTRKGWLNGETISQEYPDRITLGEFANDKFPAELRQFVRAQRNGEPFDDWENYIPCTDEHILLYIVPQGSGEDGDKSPVLAIVGIAIAIAAPYAAPAIATAMGVSTLAATGIYWVGATLVMNSLSRALIKPPQQQNPVDFSRSSNPFLYFSGIGNRMEPWGNVPRIYGRMRYYPKLVMPPEQRTLGSSQYFFLAFDFGYGPLQLSNFKLGETALNSYTGVEYKIHHNFTKTSVLEYFDTSALVSSVNLELLPNSGNTLISGTPVNTNSAIVSLAFPSGLYTIDKITGKNAQTVTYFRVEARRIDGTPTAWDSIDKYARSVSAQQFLFQGGTQVRGPSSDFSFSMPLDVWQENGVWYTGIVAGRSQISLTNTNFFNPGLNSWDAGDSLWIYGLPGLDEIAFWRPIAGFTGGNKQRPIMSWDGRQIVVNSYASAAQVPMSPITTLKMRPRDVGYSYTQLQYAIVNDGSVVPLTNPFVLEMQFYFEFPGEYEVRITNTSNAQSSTVFIFDDMYWATFVTYSGFTKKVFSPEAPHTVMELKIRATNQLSGMIDNFNAVAESLLPIWNGTSWDIPALDPSTNLWSVPPTRNPAWIYLDVVRGSANRNPVSDDLIDLPAFLNWAQKCELPAPNDPDNPSFNCDLVISAESTVRETLQTIASVGRAAPARRDSKLSIILHEADQPPVQLITPKNSNDFSASINYVDPPHALKISYIDETSGYSSTDAIVYNDGYDESNATVFESLTLPGSTRYQQVWRLGRYYMAAAQLQRERVRVTMDYENLVCQRGDLVLVAHDVLKAGGLPRRVNEVIVDSGGDILVLDEAVTTTTAIRYRASDTIIAVSQIGDNEIRLPIGQAPPIVGDLIEYGVSETIRAPFIVEEITPGGNLSATLLMVEHRPEIDDAITQPIPARIPRPGASGEYAISSVINLQAVTVEYESGGNRLSEISLTWFPSSLGIPSYYVVYLMLDGIPVWIGRTDQNSYQNAMTVNLSSLESGENYTFGVQAVIDRVGYSPIETVTVSVVPDTTPPPDVTGFGCNAQTGTLFLFWDAFDALQMQEIDHFEIRYSYDAIDGIWGTASLLNDRISANSTDTIVPLRPGIYFIKAVDGAGNYSENAASTVVQIDDLEYVDEFAVLSFAPFDDGTYDRVNIDVPGQLRLDENELIGYYYPDPADFGISLLAQSKMRLYANVQGSVVAYDSTLDSPWFDPIANAIPIQTPLQLGSNAIDAQIDFRWKPTPSDPWSAWTRLYVADVTATLVEFRIMLRTKNLAFTPNVTAAGVRADWLERDETGSDIPVSASGERVDFTYAFAETPVVAITLEGAIAGDNYNVYNLDRFGFDIDIFDGTGTQKAGQIDYIARGYGKEY